MILRSFNALWSADVSFTLSEMFVGRMSRLFFTRGNSQDTRYDGVFSLPGPNVEISQVLTVYAMVGAQFVWAIWESLLCFQSDFLETRPYRLLLDLNDIERTIVGGQQTISDTSAFPRVRQRGDTMVLVR